MNSNTPSGIQQQSAAPWLLRLLSECCMTRLLQANLHVHFIAERIVKSSHTVQRAAASQSDHSSQPALTLELAVGHLDKGLEPPHRPQLERTDLDDGSGKERAAAAPLLNHKGGLVKWWKALCTAFVCLFSRMLPSLVSLHAAVLPSHSYAASAAPVLSGPVGVLLLVRIPDSGMKCATPHKEYYCIG
jgi:hypothetical protein